jgi:hypothetical protein
MNKLSLILFLSFCVIEDSPYSALLLLRMFGSQWHNILHLKVAALQFTVSQYLSQMDILFVRLLKVLQSCLDL